MQKFQSWDKARAQEYIRTYGIPQEPKGAHKIRMQAASNFVDENIFLMDIPCGIGHLYPFVKHEVDYLGIDASPHMLEVARRHFPEANFVLADIYNIADFVTPDIIVCLSLFIHLPEPFKILKLITEHFFEKAIIGLEIGKRAIYRTVPRGEKLLIVRRETPKIVKDWLNKLNIQNYFIEKIEGNTHYLVIEK